jgi:hypothetical protein
VGHALWPSNEEAVSIYQRVASGFVSDYGGFSTLWPTMTAHLNDDEREMAVTKCSMIHASAIKIAEAKAKQK